ncbi:hypothetical protein Smar_1533 [Staphylothermus marinus F1]|uniref:PepSY domain-containing protein n=1 Tax=Staphylothermus marinus (strain ATCC 43588 / DSM 3639 / JCM 9404 / F1) TaxID=399550 RepID=A3DPR0_STAMF|nr:hypothetical protein [Staphylothermus marinus]ABN70620.1 hypothetical protein Smar_1533 [Staphylothermus marinus F1]
MEAEEALDKAIEFLEKRAGYYFHRLESISLKEGVWIIRFDVGIFAKEVVEVRIDDKTGRVIGFGKISRGA